MWGFPGNGLEPTQFCKPDPQNTTMHIIITFSQKSPPCDRTKPWLVLDRCTVDPQDQAQVKIPSMDPPLVPEIDGYLLKLKHHRPVLVSAWNRRYFCTVTMADGTGALYDSHYKKAKAKKVILMMSQITSVQKFDELAFQINCQNQQSYLLRSESAAQLTCWVPPLQRHIQELSTYKNFLEYERRQKLDNN